jgi:pimeloyl-ACP methyl ester carboxylesterase
MTIAASPFVRGGALLHVDDAGGNGVPVVFQHGLCGDARQTAEVFPTSASFRRITLECRGHGSSAAGDFREFSLANFTDDVIALIETTGDAPVVVGGISMGAAIALRLAVRRPELVRGLILARPAWVTAAAPRNLLPNVELGALLAELPADEARAVFLATDTAQRLAQAAPDNLASLVGFFERPHQAETAALLQQISSDGPGISEQNLRALEVPTLIIGTGRDAIHPLAHAEALAELIPGARLVTITSKADNRARYVGDFQHALGDFLNGFV